MSGRVEGEAECGLAAALRCVAGLRGYPTRTAGGRRGVQPAIPPCPICFCNKSRAVSLPAITLTPQNFRPTTCPFNFRCSCFSFLVPFSLPPPLPPPKPRLQEDLLFRLFLLATAPSTHSKTSWYWSIAFGWPFHTRRRHHHAGPAAKVLHPAGGSTCPPTEVWAVHRHCNDAAGVMQLGCGG